MATLTKADSKHMYSWWWDSHISPKNSKWLQQNLADTDAKVKQMIKLVEVDEDSFARRAEMYYKKRPELMKLIEEFYRAYRALAERYDHATGVIKQAHQAMAEVFPNQVPFDEAGDGSFSFANGSDPHSPEALVSLRAFHDLDELSYTEKDGALGSIKPQRCSLLVEGRVRKSLKFHDADAKTVQILKNDECTEKDQAHLDSERLGRSETDIQALKEALASLEAEKQAGMLECEESLRRLSKLESEVMRAQEDSSGLHVRASDAEAEVQSLKESLSQLEGEREANLQKYQQCLDRISSLESNVSLAREETQRLDRQACKAEKDALILTEELVKINAEKEAYLAKYLEALEKIANLENRLSLAEDKASMTSDRAHNAEKEVEALKEAFDRATEEKEAASLQHHICLDKILTLEREIALSHEEAKRLRDEIDQGSAKLKVAEEQCLVLEKLNKSMQDELDSFSNELGAQNQELSEKQKELENLWTSVQDERSRFMEAETALRTLQGLHSQTQDELRSAATELQRKVQLMKDMEFHGQALQDEVQRIRKENKSLSEVNLSSSVSLKSIQDENSKLRESCQRSEAEIAALSEKLARMEKLTEKRAVLEQYLSELSAELEATREKVEALEESYQLLMKEKSAVIDEKGSLNHQLEIVSENLESLTTRNTCLDRSLFQANEELGALRMQSKNLEVSCRMLDEDKSILASERHALEIKLETSQGRLETMKKINEGLQQKYVAAEEQRESALKLAENLRSSLFAEKKEKEIAAKSSRMQMEGMENKIHNLQQEGEATRGQLKDELDKSVNSQFEIFILRNIMHDLQATNSSLLSKCGKLLESSKLSEKLLLELEYENIEQQEEENFLSEHIKILRMGMFQLLKVLDVDLEITHEGNFLDDQNALHHLLIKLDDMRNDLCKAWDENQKLLAEKSVLETLHKHLKEEVADLKVLINTLQLEFRNGNNQLSSLHKDMPKLLQSHEELILKVTEGNHKEDLLAGEVNNLRAKILQMQGMSQNVEKENCRILGEKKSLMKEVLRTDEEKRKLEHDNSCLVAEALTLDTLSFVYKRSVSEKSEEIDQLANNIWKLCDENSVLEDKVRNMECMLDKYELENLNLNDSLEKYEEALEESRITNDQLQLELARERDELSQKEMELLEAVMVEDGQAKEIIKLSENYAQQLKENERLRVSKQNTDTELQRVLKKQTQTEEMVEKGKSEAELWETVAGSFFAELQTSSVREALFREKLAELTKEYEHIEAENNSKGLEFVQMKGRLESLEGENNQVRAQLAQLIPSLKDSLASLESHAIHTDYEDDFYKDTASSHKTSEDEEYVSAASSSDKFPDLQDIAVRMKVVEKKVMEMKKLSQERSFRALKSRSSRSRRGSGRSGRRVPPPEPTMKQPAKETAHYQSTKPHQKNVSYPCEAGELMMKDIMLDQPSETRWSLSKTRRGLYTNSESDDQILELWETIDQSQSIDLTVEVDKQEIQTKSIDSKKVLESLAYDVQRLANLQITVQDLKHKVANTENSNPTKGKGIEYVRVKEQLNEYDKAITKLLNLNGKLMKKLDSYSPASSVGNTPSSVPDSPDLGESKRKTDVFQQARRCSQKVGRIQADVQKTQFVLLNLDGGGGNKMGRASGTRVSERNSKILLKDYLYVGARTPRRKKKAHFCGCVQPHTSGE